MPDLSVPPYIQSRVDLVLKTFFPLSESKQNKYTVSHTNADVLIKL